LAAVLHKDYNAVLKYERKNLSNDKLIELFKAILLPRMIEEKMLLLLRQGKISKWFSGMGQEGIAVGSTMALDDDEYVMPLHRNLGVFTSRKIPLDILFKQLQGKEGGFSNGRERSFHFGNNEHHIIGMISHLGPQMCVADGVALANLLLKNNKIALAYTGEGGTSEGDFHEALNIAAVWQLPVIFIIENNGYGLSTPTTEQFRNDKLFERAAGYGMKGLRIEGNNILEVYHTISELKQKISKKPEPVLVECMTFRMRGHEEASGVKYVPKDLFEKWEKFDPVTNYQQWLINENVLNENEIKKFRVEITAQIEAGLKSAFDEPEVVANTEKEIAAVFKSHDAVELKPKSNKTTKKRLVDSISDGLRGAMKKYPNLILMGQDIAEYGGVFKVTEGFVEEFGIDRVRNTPICESGILSAGVGLSAMGFKSVIEMQFADFVSSGFNAVVNNLAKLHYRWGQNADVVVRMPTGAGVGAGPFHSQSNEAWFTHVPGLKVVYPSNAIDAKGLLLAAIEDPNPVMYFEHKALYRAVSDEVFDDDYTIPIGKAKLIREGNEVSIITYGMGVHWALETLSENPNISADVLDLRTLSPLDYEAIEISVKKTGKAIILHEDTMTGGIGGDISAWISENCFSFLDAPVIRSASLDTPVPFALPLENNFLPKERFKKQLKQLLEY